MVTEKLEYKIVGPMMLDKKGRRLIVVKSTPTPAGSLRLLDMNNGKMLDFAFSTVPELLSCNAHNIDVLYKEISV